MKLKETFESKGSKASIKKTNVMISGVKLLKSKVDPYAKFGKRVMDISVLYTKCGK